MGLWPRSRDCLRKVHAAETKLRISLGVLIDTSAHQVMEFQRDVVNSVAEGFAGPATESLSPENWPDEKFSQKRRPRRKTAFRSSVHQLRRRFFEPYVFRLANAACEVLPIVVIHCWSFNIGNLGVVERWSPAFQSPMREIGARFLSSFDTLCISSTIIANR